LLFKNKHNWFSKNLNENIKILNTGDFSIIPWIFCVFAENSAKHKLIAAKALCSILDKLTFSDICRIDAQMRQTTSMEWSINWKTFNIQNFFTHRMSINEMRAITIFSSFNPNGYIREQAVKLLCLYELTLPYIILRQNDWVMQVRQAAILSFDSKMNSASNEEMLLSLPFLEKLRRGSRDLHSHSIENFFEQLNNPNRKNILITGLRSQEVLTRRLCINALLNTQIPDTNTILEHLKYEPDPFLRRIIFQKLYSFEIDMLNVSLKFLQDKYSANRILALKYLYAIKKDFAFAEALNMSLDKNAYVRELARSILKESSPNIDIHKFYIQHLNQYPQSVILGLSEIGSVVDCSIIEPYLHHNSISIVRAAMISLMRLNTQGYGNIIIEMLLNEQAGIVKTAKLLIIKYNVQDFPRILEIYRNTNVEYTQSKCAALLFTASKWQRLIYMLLVLQSESENVRQLAIESIYKWIITFNKSFLQATEEQKKTIFELVKECEDNLEKEIINQLLFLSK